MSRELRLALCAFLPVFGIAVGIVRGELHGQGAQRYRFAITGFDPRDLLQGHYLQYRLVLDGAELPDPCADETPGCALCVTRSEGDGPPAVRRVLLSADILSCSSVIHTEFLARLTRFYIPETRAQELTEKLREAAANGRAQLEVAVSEGGVPSAEALWLDDEEVRP